MRRTIRYLVAALILAAVEAHAQSQEIVLHAGNLLNCALAELDFSSRSTAIAPLAPSARHRPFCSSPYRGLQSNCLPSGSSCVRIASLWQPAKTQKAKMLSKQRTANRLLILLAKPSSIVCESFSNAAKKQV